MMRLLCQVPSALKFIRFRSTTALQRKLSCGGFLPAYRFIRRRRGYGGLVCLWASSFHFQFHDFRLV